jgi:hypothetical protein
MSEFVTTLINGYIVNNLMNGDDIWFEPSQFDDACKKLAELQDCGQVCRLVAEIDAS